MSFDLPDQHIIHETEQDRERQRQILCAYAERFGFTVEFTEQLNRQDGFLYKDGKLVELAEAKHRNNSVGLYPKYALDVEKVNSLNARAKTLNVPGKLVVSWEGDIRYLDVTDAMKDWQPGDDDVWDIGSIKRRNRAEEADRVYKIPTEDFTRL